MIFFLLFIFKTDTISTLKRNLEGYWLCNFSIPDESTSDEKDNSRFLGRKEFLLKIYKNDEENEEDRKNTNSTNKLDIFNVDFGQKINSSKSTTRKYILKSIQKYIISFDRSGTIIFQNFKEVEKKIEIKFGSSKTPQISTSGKYMDKYVFHFLIESKTKMHLSLFEIQNTTELNPNFTGSWLQFDFLKDINRSPPSRLEKSWQFILLASIFIVGYIIGFYRQSRKLEQMKSQIFRQRNKQIKNHQANETDKVKKD